MLALASAAGWLKGPDGCRGLELAALSGERHGKSRLTWAAVREIRASYATGRFTMRELARRFGVQPSQISRIVSNKLWREETGVEAKNED